MAEVASPGETPSDLQPEALRKPHDLITKEHVEAALKKDKGSCATMESYEIVDFTAKGDNYASIVTSVVVKFKDAGKSCEKTYVVKLNPCRPADFEAMSRLMFKKEIGFFNVLLPLLNAELERVGEEGLKVPTHVHSCGTSPEEVIFVEDLRPSGFKMFDRKKGMDKEHTEMILRELGRLHAASSLLLTRPEFVGIDMVERFPLLEEAFNAFADTADSKMKMEDFFPSILDNGIKIASNCGGYETVAKYLKENRNNTFQIFMEQLKTGDQFKVICHGDCWNNNFLFKYSADGSLEDCRLLDLQVVRLTSPAMDLNYMLFCSLNGDVRRKEFNSFLSQYYASFASVMAGAGVAMKFTLPQLKQEFYKKNAFGLFMGLMLIPMVLMNSEDVPDMDAMKPGDDMEKQLKEYQDLIMGQIQKNPLLKPRLLDLFDDVMESGVIPRD